MGTSEAQPIWPPLARAKTEMAEVRMNSLPSGYEYEFISTVLDDHHCLICHLPLREPVQTRCGHRFCKKCLNEAIRRYENRNRVLSLGFMLCSTVEIFSSNVTRHILIDVLVSN